MPQPTTPHHTPSSLSERLPRLPNRARRRRIIRRKLLNRHAPRHNVPTRPVTKHHRQPSRERLGPVRGPEELGHRAPRAGERGQDGDGGCQGCCGVGGD
jgi:hypothetical protein